MFKKPLNTNFRGFCCFLDIVSEGRYASFLKAVVQSTTALSKIVEVC